MSEHMPGHWENTETLNIHSFTPPEANPEYSGFRKPRIFRVLKPWIFRVSKWSLSEACMKESKVHTHSDDANIWFAPQLSVNSLYLPTPCYVIEEMSWYKKHANPLNQRSWILAPGSRISLDSRSRILNPGSLILNPGPWSQDPGSRIQDSGARILDPGPRILDQGSRILDPGSWVLDPGSRILDPWFRILALMQWSRCIRFRSWLWCSEVAASDSGSWLWCSEVAASD